ncbi:amidohydrolase family protein [Reyranella sp.]|uniref:amidohydrolase family protein n=1 Tax=Reyranella sp. TaxID=1929291 RepID=UPI004035B2F7
MATGLGGLELPDGSCDCHHHIFDPRFAYTAADRLQPPPASISRYEGVKARLGIQRSVVVQPSSYGTDNRCTLDAVARLGPGARGVAVVAPDISDAELQRLHTGGIRGIRFNLSRGGGGGGGSAETMSKLAPRIAALGWHIDLHLAGDELCALEDVLKNLEAPIVLDHLGRVPQPNAEAHPAFRLIAGLLESGRGWVKLSQLHRDSRTGPPAYEDAARLARRYLQIAPERLVWGTDWPHVVATGPVDELADLKLLLVWIGEEDLRRHVLVENPARLYDFPALA